MWRNRRPPVPSVPEGLAPHKQTYLLAERAVERGISTRIVPKQRLELSLDGRRHLFRSGKSTLNSRLAERCANQKEVTSRLLRARGVPAPENVVFAAQDVKRAWAWAEGILPVVIKPPAASKGTLVRTGVVSRDEFEDAFQLVAEAFGEVLVEQFVTGVEHRFSVVDGKVVAVTERVPPRVVGDGTASVRELLEVKNEERRARRNPLHQKPITVDAAVIATLRSQGHTLDSVPAGGEVVWLRRTSNISIGGEAVDRTDTVSAAHIELAERAVSAIPGLRLAGIDILLPDPGAMADRANGGVPTGTVVEINASPMLSMHVFPWDGRPRPVYDRVLDAMFPETRSR